MSIKGITNAGGGQAWGNIFTVRTPYIDQLGQHIYQQDQLRQLQQQKESDALDNQFSKEAANIRDADVNDYADMFNQYKQAKIGLMKMNPNNIDSKAYIQAQLDANRKLAAMSQFGNESIANKAALKEVNTQYGKDTKGIYDRNAGNMISKATSLPSSQWNTLGFDPTDNESYKYKANPDKWNKVLTGAIGKQPSKIEYDEKLPATEGLGTAHKTITGMSSPAQVSQTLTTQSINNPGEFLRTYESQFPPERVAQITQDYNDKIANNPDSPEYKLYGENGVKLPQNGTLTEQQALANTLAMNYMLTHRANVTSVKNDYNKVGVMNKQQGFQQAQQARNFNQQDYLAGLRNNYSKSLYDYKQAKSAGEQDNVLNKYIDNSYNAGSTRLNGTNVTGINIDGKHYEGKVIDLPVSVKKEFVNYNPDGTVKSFPDAYYLTNDKKTIIPLSLGAKVSTGGYQIHSESKPQDIQVLKAALSKSLLTKKTTGNEVTGGEDDASNEFPDAPTTTTEIHKTKTKKTAKDYGL
jgi:hypothetical protein